MIRRYPTLELLVGLGVPLGVLAALDFAWLRLGQTALLEVATRVAFIAAALITPVVFWRLLRRSLPGGDTPFRWAAVAILTLMCSLAWYYIAFTLFVNIHLGMGGSL